jgi:hypothetical protein
LVVIFFSSSPKRDEVERLDGANHYPTTTIRIYIYLLERLIANSRDLRRNSGLPVTRLASH